MIRDERMVKAVGGVQVSQYTREEEHVARVGWSTAQRSQEE